MKQDIASLIHRARNGDNAALEELLCCYGEPAAIIIRKYCLLGDVADVETQALESLDLLRRLIEMDATDTIVDTPNGGDDQ